jgi:hypothetical protein
MVLDAIREELLVTGNCHRSLPTRSTRKAGAQRLKALRSTDR